VTTRLRQPIAKALWHAHPARPGREYAALRASQWWWREQLEELQVHWLRRLVAAAEQVPFHCERLRAAGVGAVDIRTIADLGRLPIFERGDLARLGLAGTRVPKRRGMRASTSGSLGVRAELLWPLQQMRWLDASEARARGWLGAELGARNLEVRCRPVGRPQKLAAVILNAEAIHAPTVADRETVRRLVASLDGQPPPSLVWGVSNALYVVARALLDDGRTLQADACWSGGNHLHAHYRAALEEAFGCEVFERYATMEMGLIAHECTEGRSLHVPAEGIIAEIVDEDGAPAGPGETGDVLLTSLRNDAQPFIRYRVGDRATAPLDPMCSCGRGLPVFGTVAGRTQDFLRTASGELIGPSQIIDIAAPGEGSVIDVQVIQAGDRNLQILVLQHDTAGADAERERIGNALTELIAPPQRAEVVRVEQIPLTPGGKLRTIVSLA
jgi:phenylacetate-CoA ligase